MPFAGNENPVKRLTGFFLFSTHRIYKTAATVEIGEIAAVLIDGDATLKHFYRDADIRHPRIIQHQVQAYGISQGRLR